MPVVYIREMRMAVLQWVVLMPMAVRLHSDPFKFVIVLMVCVMEVFVCMVLRRMLMFVRMVFGQVQPDTCSHERCRHPKSCSHGLGKH